MGSIADADVASVAALMGDRARCAMLQALIDGSERPAGERAKAAGVSAATASGHCSAWWRAGCVGPGHRTTPLLRAQRTACGGRHRGAIADLPTVEARSLRQLIAAAAMAEARSCYDHLAARAGIALRDTLLTSGVLSADGVRDFRLTDRGLRFLGEFGLDPDPILRSRRMLARDCLDWTERKPHLAGALLAALLAR